MKTTLKLSLLAVLFLGTVVSCQKVEKTTIYTANVPQYMSYESLRNSVFNDNDEALERPGKIFLYNSLILINDFEKGIHIYDNRNPSSPQHIAFINIPGNVDIAVNDNLLYVDSYVDLVSIDISDPTQVREVGRLENALSYTIPSSMDPSYPVAKIEESKGVVVGYKVGEVEETCKNQDCDVYYNNHMEDWGGAWNGGMMNDEGTPVSFSGNASNVRSSSSSANSAIAGSMARFMMIDQFLYAISDENTVKIFDMSTNTISEVNSFNPWQEAGNNGLIETLYTFKDHLFIGSNAGMLAYDVSSPSNPQYLSHYVHMTACDPVVANDEYAFVTLRSNNDCNWSNENQLDVMDIADILEPNLLFSVPMSEPHGLDIDSDNELVFVCDGQSGVKVYDYKTIDENRLNELGTLSGFDTYDVILSNGRAHVIGGDGLKQFSYTADGQATELSTIPLN